MAVRSPRKGHTIQQLRALKEAGWHNADTGTELSQGEGEEYLMRLQERAADRSAARTISALGKQRTRSKGRPWIPKGQVIFRRINGRNVPFRKTDDSSEPWL